MSPYNDGIVGVVDSYSDEDLNEVHDWGADGVAYQTHCPVLCVKYGETSS